MRRILSSFVVVAAAATFVTPAYATDEFLQPPSSSEVLDPFRAPTEPYGSGNRGIEYDTAADDPIVAAGSGLVVFAGPVGGQLHITIDHGDGLLSSYSFVDTLTVRSGTQVQAGQPIAVAGGPFHFGTRMDDDYVDPASLFGVIEVSVALVEHSDPGAMDRYLDLMDRSERLQYAKWLQVDKPSFWKRFIAGASDVIGATVDLFVEMVTKPFTVIDLNTLLARLAAAIKWVAEAVHDLTIDGFSAVDLTVIQAKLTDLAGAVAGTVHEQAHQLAYVVGLDIMVAAALAIRPRECTKPEVRHTPVPGRRIAVRVPGLGSSSDTHAAIDDLDLAALGYAADDIIRAGYRIGPDGAVEYGPEDTHQSVEQSAKVLLAQLQRVAAESPGVPIDVYAHSLGGVVSAQAIASGTDGLVDSLVTFSSPFGGTPAAELVNVVADLAPLAGVVDLLWKDDPLGAAVVNELEHPSIVASEGFPSSTRLLTFGHSNDFIVPAHLARVRGHDHITVGSDSTFNLHRGIADHSAVTSHPDALREIMLFRAGQPPTCTSAFERMANAIEPRLKGRAVAVVGEVLSTPTDRGLRNPLALLPSGLAPFATSISPHGAPGGWRRYSLSWPE